MRPGSVVCLSLLAVAACTEPDAVALLNVDWLEWPAEVHTAKSFTVRVVVERHPCGYGRAVVTPVALDQSAVTFEPYSLVRRECLERPPDLLLGLRGYDTVALVPGLTAGFSRIYEIRAAARMAVPAGTVLEAAKLPVRTFGSVTVRIGLADTSLTNAAGFARIARDSATCPTLVPGGLYSGYVIENAPADTARFLFGFIHGYLYRPATPLCGKQRVFHLVSVN